MTLLDSTRIEPNPAKEDQGYVFVQRLAKGLNVSLRPELIDDEQLQVANNIRFDKDNALVDLGYTTFGQVLRGKPRATFQFFLKNGSSITTCITHATVYRWNSTVLEWQYISNGTSTTLTVAAVTTDTALTVASITGFAAGEHIGIALDDGTQHRTTVNGAPSGSTINITDAMPSGAAISSLVVEAMALSGSDDIPVSLVVWPAFDKLYFTNGVDAPQEFDGTSITEIANLPGTTFKCRVVQLFKNHLLLLHTEEDGTAFPQRVRWSEPGSDSNFNDLVNFVDLYDSEDWIVAAEHLGDFLAIYKERSIYRVEFLGLADQDFQFTRTIDAEGALNQDAVINLGDEHIFMGNANIYTYDGGFSLNPVGDNIFEKIFANTGELNGEFAHRSFGVYVEELDEARWFYPAGADEFPKNEIRYKVATQAWSSRVYPIEVVGFGFFQTAADLTWQTISGTWESQLFNWTSKTTQADAPTIHLCSGGDLRVYEYNYTAADDNGTAIAYELVTKDFYVPNWDLRFDRYEFFLQGTSILVEASYDFGESWTTLGTVSPGTVFTRVRLWKQKIGRSIRFRFSGSNQFGLGWLAFAYKMENVLEP